MAFVVEDVVEVEDLLVIPVNTEVQFNVDIVRNMS